jgi:predicted nucleic acid-binding protein
LYNCHGGLAVDVVVDTSVIVAVIANEPVKAALIELTRGADLIAPPSVHWEVGNALSAMLRRKRATLEAILEAAGAYAQIPIRFVDVELEETLRIAASMGLYAYDACLIRCALKYSSPLISLDGYLIECARLAKAQIIEVNT